MNAIQFTVHVKKSDENGTINPSDVGSAYGHYEGVRWTHAADAGTYGVFHLVVNNDGTANFIIEELEKDDRVISYDFDS